MTGSYTVTYTPSVQSGHTQSGAPTFVDPASNGLDNQSGTTTGASYHGYFSDSITANGASLTKNLAQIDPSGSCGSYCVGGNTQTGTVTVTFSFTAPSGGTSV